MAAHRYSRAWRSWAAVREDPFSGETVPRPARIERDLDAVITDAQSRDWVADRPDRVGFARLGQVRQHVRTAAGRTRAPGLIGDPVGVTAGVVAGAVVAVALVWAGWPAVARPLPLAVAAVVAVWAALIPAAVVRRLRRRWDHDDAGGPAPIDDIYRYTAFRRRIEACAATARGRRSYRRRAAAIDLEYALDWLSAARSELPRR
ncbi:hypothetical protein [Actinoplanes utahensis]|uniref:Uncharacterized protein n=1 Tax=Actinoplanes utahensis TaxID=1869 RepID=A0A0A6X728_ACTUT|nr:hypothetical protein [Actinoplanes utahensis]KHD75937.1 hypothetical protein MB27_20025 [Actinoplanes utahensis]GIF35039.1 hypothetical protein Aut01nite_80250 [Actinoplanes utahensis]